MGATIARSPMSPEIVRDESTHLALDGFIKPGLIG